MRLFIYIMCGLFSTTVTYGFNSFSNEIEVDPTVMTTVQSLQTKAKEAKDHNVGEALQHVENALDLAKSINHDSLIQRIENSKALYLLLSAEYSDAKLIIERLIPLYEDQDRMYHVAVLRNRLANINIKLGNYKEATTNALKAIELFEPKSKRQLGISNIYLGEIYRNTQQYKKAFKHIQSAIEYQESNSDTLYINMALTELGRLQWDIEDYVGANNTFQRAINLDIKNEQFLILPNLYLGKIEYIHGNYLLSKSYIEKAKALIEKTGNISHLAETYLFLGKISLLQHQYSEADNYSSLSLSQAQSSSNLREIHEANLLKAEIACEENRAEECINLSEKTYMFAEKGDDLELGFQAAKLLAKSYAKLNNTSKAFDYQSIFQKTKESFDKNKNAIFIKGLTTQYNLEKTKAAEIFEKEQLILKQKSRVRELLLLGLILGLVSLFLFGIQRQKTNLIEQLEHKNNRLIDAEGKLENVNRQLLDKNSQLTSYIDNELQLENFTHIASHDLKAPLREQASFIQFLEHETSLKLSKREQNYISYISQSNADMQSLIDGMIEYSHLKSHTYSFSEIDPIRIVKEAEYINRDIILREKATVVINDLPETIHADKYKLVLVFRNLIQNSLIYKKENVNPYIEIGGEEKIDKTVFWVKDNGKGINEKYSDHIFGLFKRLITHKEAPGNGLGLAMVKEVVQKHNGEVWIKSEIDKGTIIYFSIAS